MNVIWPIGAIVVTADLLVRMRVVGRLPLARFWIAALVAVVAIGIGTNVKISGVLLAVLAIPPVVWAVATDRWRLGNTGLMLTILGLGIGAAYVIAATIEPDTGSYGDQSSILLVGMGALVSLAAIVWSLVRHPARTSDGRA